MSEEYLIKFFFISLLPEFINNFSHRNKTFDYPFALVVNFLSIFYCVMRFKFVLPLNAILQLLLVFFSESFYQLFVLEFGINKPCLLLIFDFFVEHIFILNNHFFVLPGPPYLILDFLLLLGSLFKSVDDVFLLSVYFNQLMFFPLLHYHFSSSLLPLVPSLLNFLGRLLLSWFFVNLTRPTKFGFEFESRSPEPTLVFGLGCLLLF